MTPGSVAMLLGETTGLRVQTTAPSLGAANVRVQGLRGRYAQLLADGLPLYGSGGDSLGLLQVPPLDLGQVEVIKGAASALYGPAALGGVINLVSRRAAGVARRDVAQRHVAGRRRRHRVARPGARSVAGPGRLLGGAHGQRRRDMDDDGWTDVAAYQRGVVRPRVFYESGAGASLFLTGGLIAEDREAGTIGAAVAPDGLPFAERLETRRADVGGLGRWLLGTRVLTARGSYSRNGQDRRFGDVRERGTRQTAFGEASLTGASGRHGWVLGAAFQQDRYAPVEESRFAYTFSVPAVFAQDQIDLGRIASVSASARLDAHSEYGALFSPRLSLLLRPSTAWTMRVSGGGGSFAPTPFTEETDETGLARVARLVDLEAERAVSFSGDLTWTHGGFEVTGTVFGSRVSNPVQLAELPHILVVPERGITVGLVNAAQPTRTWGTELLARYRHGAFVAMATHAWTRATELDVDQRRAARGAADTGACGVAECHARRQRVGTRRHRGLLHRAAGPRRQPVPGDEPRVRPVRRPRRAAAGPGAPVPQRREPGRRPPDEVRPAHPADPAAGRPLDRRGVGAARRPGLERRRPIRLLTS